MSNLKTPSIRISEAAIKAAVAAPKRSSSHHLRGPSGPDLTNAQIFAEDGARDRAIRAASFMLVDRIARFHPERVAR